jgi:hypothetical protein
MVKPEIVIAWHRRGFASMGVGKVGIAMVTRLYLWKFAI